MKRQILQGLIIMLICFMIGGSYIIYAIGDATSELERAMTLHKAQGSMMHMQEGVHIIDNSLRRGRPLETNLLNLASTDIKSIEDTIRNCSSCSFSTELLAHLDQLKLSYDQYSKGTKQLLQQPLGSKEYQSLSLHLLQHGTVLNHEITLILRTLAKGTSDTPKSLYHDITKVRHLIIFLVIVGPIAVLLLTAFFLKKFTGSIDTLTNAASLFRGGDLDYRISENLQYEFKDLANSFNSMVSSLKLQRDDLFATRTMYQTLFESAGEGIFILDLAPHHYGRIISVNSAAATMHGYPKEELLDMNISDVTIDDNCEQRLDYALKRDWVKFIVKRKKKDGSDFLAEASVGKINMPEEKYALVFNRDITQQKKEEKKLQRANQLALVGEMAAGLAHEIKNPLAGIKVSLEVLADELVLSNEDKELFHQIINETFRVEKLLKGLLNYARPAKLNYSTFDLHKLLDNAVKNISLARKNSAQGNIEFVKHYPSEPLEIEADSAQLQQVFLNILLNAIEEMIEGGEIEISSTVIDEEMVQIAISDTGPGIQENRLNDIFLPFNTRKSKGTGLGLAICKRISEDHNGSIEADNNESLGATLTVTLPLKQS
jgi:two-component system, NtrC family, sensor histidine kinase AtoS